MQFGIDYSRFIQTSSILRSQVSLNVGEDSAIRFLGKEEANALVEQLRKRNVFARHSWENNFYIQKAQSLAERTVIETYLPGDPKTIADEAEKIAGLIVKIIVLSTTFAIPKPNLLRKISLRSKPNVETNFIVGPKFRYPRSRSHSSPTPEGIIIDERFKKRFLRSGFEKLALFLLSKSEISTRVSHSLDWLYESRTETELAASIVKSSIALESLLVFSESESLGQSLSERTAFILSQDPKVRRDISRLVKRFYDIRSGIVHGGRKRKKGQPDSPRIS